jgi:hypothetical protein
MRDVVGRQSDELPGIPLCGCAGAAAGDRRQWWWRRQPGAAGPGRRGQAGTVDGAVAGAVALAAAALAGCALAVNIARSSDAGRDCTAASTIAAHSTGAAAAAVAASGAALVSRQPGIRVSTAARHPAEPAASPAAPPAASERAELPRSPGAGLLGGAGAADVQSGDHRQGRGESRSEGLRIRSAEALYLAVVSVGAAASWPEGTR